MEWMLMRLKILVLVSALGVASFGLNGAQAAGCLSGGAVGAVAGHVAGHHAVLGAVGGCIAGHEINKHRKEQAAQQQQNAQKP
jgi:uncharacterized protein YcfJ